MRKRLHVAVFAIVATFTLASCGGGGGGGSSQPAPKSSGASTGTSSTISETNYSPSSIGPKTGANAPVQSTGPARYVDPSHPAARDSGAGTAAQPYRTITYAISQLRPGDTLNIASGVYRETINLPQIGWSGKTVIQSTGGGIVTIKGSDAVTGWQAQGNGVFMKRPWTANSQQVFVDGVALKQVGGTILNGYPERSDHPMNLLHASQGGIWPGRTPGGVAQLTPNSFHYDAGSQSLYIKVPYGSLDGHTVEASVRTFLVYGQKLNGIVLRDLRFQHANTTSASYSGALTMTGDQLVLERIEISRVDGNGTDIIGNGNIIKDSRANYCGQVGMKVRGRNNRLINNETNYNNTRGFNKWWEAGGAKFVGDGGLRDSEVTRHRAIGNNGDGIWFDWLNSNNLVHRNLAAYNTGFGIHYEASQKGYIYDNYVFGNGQRGIYLPHSAESVIAHNVVVKNGMEGIAIVDEGRNPERSELRPRSNHVFGNIVAWNAKSAIVLPVGLLGSTSDYNLILNGRSPSTFALGWSGVKNGIVDWRAASGQDGNSWNEFFDVPSELQAAFDKKQDDPNWSPVIAIASRYRVPAASEQSQTRSGGPYAPGPRG